PHLRRAKLSRFKCGVHSRRSIEIFPQQHSGVSMVRGRGLLLRRVAGGKLLSSGPTAFRLSIFFPSITHSTAVDWEGRRFVPLPMCMVRAYCRKVMDILKPGVLQTVNVAPASVQNPLLTRITSPQQLSGTTITVMGSQG